MNLQDGWIALKKGSDGTSNCFENGRKKMAVDDLNLLWLQEEQHQDTLLVGALKCDMIKD